MAVLTAPESGVVIEPGALLRSLAGVRPGAADRRLAAEVIRHVHGDAVAGLPPREARGLERMLRLQSRWLLALTVTEGPADAVLAAGVVRGYRRARKAMRRDPFAGRSRRRVERLMWIQALLAGRVETAMQGRVPGSPAGRLWLSLEHDRWLRRLPGTAAAQTLPDPDTRRLSKLLRRRRRQRPKAVAALDRGGARADDA